MYTPPHPPSVPSGGNFFTSTLFYFSVLTCVCVYRLSAEVLALSLGVSQSECQWDFLHPVGSRSLHSGRGSGLLHHHTPLLVVPQSGQSAGGCGLSHSDSPGQAESQKGRAGGTSAD